MYMNLIIVSHLSSDPPSEGLYFRYLTMMAKHELDYTVTIEAEKDEVDFYYNFLKERGWFDFIDDIILPEWREEGVRIDSELNYPFTIRANYIRCENTPHLLGQLKSIRNI
jgi:hypothetical protein